MKLHTASIVVRIAIVYRPPSSKVNKLTSAQFFHDFNDLLEHFSFSSGRLLIMGDFNFHVNEPSRDRLAAKFLTVGPNHPSNVRQKRGFFGQSTITLFVFVLCVRDLAANSKRTSQSN